MRVLCTCTKSIGTWLNSMAKQKGDQLPSIEKMFEVAVRSVVELGEMLGLSIDQVVELIKVAWQTEVNYKEEKENGK